MINILSSIDYALRHYEYYNHKEPEIILVNYNCYEQIISEIETNIKGFATLWSIPLKVIERLEETPKFWLCMEGTIYNDKL